MTSPYREYRLELELAGETSEVTLRALSPEGAVGYAGRTCFGPERGTARVLEVLELEPAPPGDDAAMDPREPKEA